MDRMTPAPSAAALPGPPRQCATLMVADVEGFGPRGDREQMQTREGLYRAFRDAFGEVLWTACHREDRGDGLLMLIPPSVPPAALLTEVLPALERALGARRRSDPLLRVRIALHAGDVHADENGWGGHAVNETFRLCGSPVLREALRAARSDTAVLLSAAVHDSAVRGGHPGIRPGAFHAVDVEVKELRTRAWLHVIGDDEAAHRVARRAQAQRPQARHDGAALPAGGSSVHVGGDLSVGRGATFAGRDVRGHAPRGHWWRRG